MTLNLFVTFLTICTVLSSFLLLITSNRIYSILYLILIYMCVSILMMYLGITVLGLFYFLVYIGAVAVLFLFSIMILDLKEFTYERDYSTFGYIFSILLIFSIQLYLMYSSFDMYIYNFNYEYYFFTNELLTILGLIIFKKYYFILLLAGLILLTSMMGSIYLTNYKKGFFINKQLFSLSRNHHLYHFSIY